MAASFNMDFFLIVLLFQLILNVAASSCCHVHYATCCLLLRGIPSMGQNGFVSSGNLIPMEGTCSPFAFPLPVGKARNAFTLLS